MSAFALIAIIERTSLEVRKVPQADVTYPFACPQTVVASIRVGQRDVCLDLSRLIISSES
jgi:hypothetical protein